MQEIAWIGSCFPRRLPPLPSIAALAARAWGRICCATRAAAPSASCCPRGNAGGTSTNALTGYYARGKVKGAALGVYGTWRPPHEDPYAGFYVDVSLQTPERYDSKARQGAVEAGYAMRVGGAANGGLYLEPQLQVGYNRWDDLRHTEANGTVVTRRDADGLFGRAGVRLDGVTRWGTSAAQVQPYVAAHWLHQRAASGVLMDDEAVDAYIPRSRGEFSAAASLKFANGVARGVGCRCSVPRVATRPAPRWAGATAGKPCGVGSLCNARGSDSMCGAAAGKPRHQVAPGRCWRRCACRSCAGLTGSTWMSSRSTGNCWPNEHPACAGGTR
ncbi:autotransporter outer membrane beta-barrel domain-containing protein [Stenotrophomonas maltophilia]|uniref:autotransporter outer membrane beta-barrel domain-containing protein n=1 Tax=Stenotrophomonas maltophilia TaxID=40324 RepID=UPI001EE3A537|nr:autotransporter outer membrane beta-barrel domain-containing protein [Stenotrophomonas maltophilia]